MTEKSQEVTGKDRIFSYGQGFSDPVVYETQMIVKDCWPAVKKSIFKKIIV